MELIGPVESAHAAGLRYVVDTIPGIRRRRAGKGFYYLRPDGATIRDPEILRRIKALAIPPAWTDVWVCPDPRGHLQATGFDARGRKQYRYHPRWREVRDAAKYDRMVAFGEALPRIRERTGQDMALPGMPREKVLAAVVRLLDATLIRVGNEEYTRENSSFGLTTLRDDHAQVVGPRVRFSFRGKSGKHQFVEIMDRRLARVVKQCQDLPGQELFQYLDDEGEPHTIESGDVNAYLREISGGDFTAKDFRTWAGSVLAAGLLRGQEFAGSEREARGRVAAAIKGVAQRLGNTPAVSRRCYVHPAVVGAYLNRSYPDLGGGAGERDGEEGQALLSEDERALLTFLRQQDHPLAEAA